MSRTSSLTKLARGAASHQIKITIRPSIIPTIRPVLSSQIPRTSSLVPNRFFSSTPISSKGIQPESSDPAPKEAESNITYAAPAELSIERYNELSDEYMESILGKLEQLQEEREDVDVEYSAGVLTLNFPPTGTYVINKQPPNKQIWLSSPISGPKRYDFVVQGEGQDSKEGTGGGEWVYLRDGTTLSGLLMQEVGVNLSEPYAPVPHLGE